MSGPNGEECGNCYFSQLVNKDLPNPDLECRRFPPSVDVKYDGEEDIWDREFINTREFYWCGEFKQREASND